MMKKPPKSRARPGMKELRKSAGQEMRSVGAYAGREMGSIASDVFAEFGTLLAAPALGVISLDPNRAKGPTKQLRPVELTGLNSLRSPLTNLRRLASSQPNRSDTLLGCSWLSLGFEGRVQAAPRSSQSSTLACLG